VTPLHFNFFFRFFFTQSRNKKANPKRKQHKTTAARF
jgi:hypothetical protein